MGFGAFRIVFGQLNIEKIFTFLFFSPIILFTLMLYYHHLVRCGYHHLGSLCSFCICNVLFQLYFHSTCLLHSKSKQTASWGITDGNNAHCLWRMLTDLEGRCFCCYDKSLYYLKLVVQGSIWGCEKCIFPRKPYHMLV